MRATRAKTTSILDEVSETIAKSAEDEFKVKRHKKKDEGDSTDENLKHR